MCAIMGMCTVTEIKLGSQQCRLQFYDAFLTRFQLMNEQPVLVLKLPILIRSKYSIFRQYLFRQGALSEQEIDALKVIANDDADRYSDLLEMYIHERWYKGAVSLDKIDWSTIRCVILPVETFSTGEFVRNNFYLTKQVIRFARYLADGFDKAIIIVNFGDVSLPASISQLSRKYENVVSLDYSNIDMSYVGIEIRKLLLSRCP